MVYEETGKHPAASCGMENMVLALWKSKSAMGNPHSPYGEIEGMAFANSYPLVN